ncbi:unnamed protein product [Caenorhabditis auriculariae]|uniref:PUM-HD domain-containing protein n=1 Tax=Caenorhabditis auriculariae TaxID=2777116 RepID=A0A8S1HWL4_9PELO|nr:unnamed protein product [Caenorhabditis auriculariae]
MVKAGVKPKPKKKVKTAGVKKGGKKVVKKERANQLVTPIKKRLSQLNQEWVQKIEEKRKEKELNHIMRVSDEDTKDSVCTESSFGSQPAPKKEKKRVSFSRQNHTKTFESSTPIRINEGSFPERKDFSTPVKGILSKGSRKEAMKEAKLLISEPSNEKKPPLKRRKTENEDFAEENKENGPETNEAFKTKKRISIRVTKSVKEQLLQMNKKDRKAFLRTLHAKKNPHLEAAEKSKALWEKIRAEKTPESVKEKCITELVGLVKGIAKNLIYAHDTCRVIQCLVMTGREGIIKNLFEELKPELQTMAKSTYAKFFVQKLLKNGSKEQKQEILDKFKGHASSMLRNSNAAKILEFAYNDVANAAQRADIMFELYGRDMTRYREDCKDLKGLLEIAPEKKTVIINHMEEIVDALVSKETVQYSLTHRLMLEYFENCDDERKTSLLGSLADKIPHMVHTPEGSKLAMQLIWFAPAKERKLIVKNFKGLAVKAALEHYGYRVLLAIFDTVDDTVLVNKYIVSELGNEISKVIEDKYGELVIRYLVHPRDARMTGMAPYAYLSRGDGNPHSKKPREDRYQQLYEGISEALYTFLVANMEQVLMEWRKKTFVGACFETPTVHDLFPRNVPKEYRIPCYKAIAEIAKREFVPMDNPLHMIEDPSGNFILIGLLRCDKDLAAEERLSTALAETLTDEELGSWIACNKGCHILARMFDLGSPKVVSKIRKCIHMRRLEGYTFVGAKILREKLNGTYKEDKRSQ